MCKVESKCTYVCVWDGLQWHCYLRFLYSVGFSISIPIKLNGRCLDDAQPPVSMWFCSWVFSFAGVLRQISY